MSITHAFVADTDVEDVLNLMQLKEFQWRHVGTLSTVRKKREKKKRLKNTIMKIAI